MEAKLKVGNRVMVDGIRTGMLNRLGTVIARVTFDGDRNSTTCFVRSIEPLKTCLETGAEPHYTLNGKPIDIGILATKLAPSDCKRIGKLPVGASMDLAPESIPGLMLRRTQ